MSPNWQTGLKLSHCFTLIVLLKVYCGHSYTLAKAFAFCRQASTAAAITDWAGVEVVSFSWFFSHERFSLFLKSKNFTSSFQVFFFFFLDIAVLVYHQKEIKAFVPRGFLFKCQYCDLPCICSWIAQEAPTHLYHDPVCHPLGWASIVICEARLCAVNWSWKLLKITGRKRGNLNYVQLLLDIWDMPRSQVISYWLSKTPSVELTPSRLSFFFFFLNTLNSFTPVMSFVVWWNFRYCSQ